MRRPIPRHIVVATRLAALELALWAAVVLALLAGASSARAIVTAYSLQGPSGGGGGCDTGSDQALLAQASADGVFGLTYDRLVAIGWTGSGTITEIIITIANIAGSGDLTVGFYTDAGGAPGSPVAGLSQTIASGSLAEGDNSFVLDSPTEASGAWIVVMPTDTLTLDIARNSVSVVANLYNYTTTGWEGWQTADVDRELKITVMGCP